MNICFLGGARYGCPLDQTNAKKFRALNTLGKLFVVGFSEDLRPRRFKEHAHFYLLPKLPLPILRYAAVLMIGTPLVVWLILRHGVQVLVAQSPYEGFVAALAVKLAKLFGYRVGLVVEAHGDFEKSLFLYRRIRFHKPYRLLMRSLARFSIRRADVLRVISNSTREQIKRWAPEKPIIQFPAWTDIETFLQAGKAPKDGAKTIVYAGVLTPLKGIHNLVDAFAGIRPEFPNAQLHIIGREENRAYGESLRNQVNSLGLESCVQFVGAKSQAELAVCMSRAAVFVLPSLSEGLGRVVVEAMATGTPVIGSDVGGIPELFKHGVTGFLVPPGDVTALADRIRWVLDRPDDAFEIGQNARLFAKRFFSNESYVAGYRQVFEAVQNFSIEDCKHATSTL